MKQFVYPIILYFNEETNCYTVAFDDLDIYTEGDTVEEAFLKAKEFLEAYFECVVEFDETPEEASTYLATAKKNEGNIILLVNATLK
ncbi:MAG: type II toxin-antitoxin system HicB family antitoxin [Clostridia bacterium]|nr:type II toxin-antitoxin system HicB family antitoxin [Clostridia bacterium]